MMMMMMWVEDLGIFGFLRGESILPVKGVEVADDDSAEAPIGAVVPCYVVEEIGLERFDGGEEGGGVLWAKDVQVIKRGGYQGGGFLFINLSG